MRMIPSEISDLTISQAERKVFAALKAIPDPQSVALHSVHLPVHAYKRLGEIDFVVFSPALVLAIEVKGGRIRRADGEWQFLRRDGKIGHSKEGPFGQASSGLHAFEGQLDRSVGDLRQLGVAGGYMVITPDVDLPASTEIELHAYVGAKAFDAGRGMEAALRRAERFWLGRNRWGRTPIPKDLLRRMVDSVRPDFDLVPSLHTRLTDLDARFERLTAEQLERLDELEENDRLIWNGGAGSGKTFLAAEAARRACARGRVLVTCASPTLAAFLQGLLPQGNLTVLDYEHLDELEGSSFDVLIVDEAQDLMTFEHLERLGKLLKGDLDGGRWIFMLDRNNQVLAPDMFDDTAFDYLRSLGSVYANLTRNCRNTEDIVLQVRHYTGADLGVAVAGKGEPVRYQDVGSEQEEAQALDAYLDELLDGQVSPGDITVVSAAGDLATSSVRLSRRFKRIQLLRDTITHPNTRSRITWASIADIKGLENRIVCVIDLEATSLGGRLDALYVALTRARAGLWIACRPGVRESLKRLGLAQLTSGGKG